MRGRGRFNGATALWLAALAMVLGIAWWSEARLAARLGATAPDAPPNLLLVSIDSLRPDHLGVYGYQRPTSPFLDALARQSIVFECAFSTSTWTLPAHLSLLTSLYPLVHGVERNRRRLPQNAVLISEVLGMAGYRSAAVVSGPYLRSAFGYGQGWQTYDDSITTRSNRVSHRQVTSIAVTDRAISRLDDLQPGPFLLFVHYWDVHYDYLAPAKIENLFTHDYHGPVDGKGIAHSPLVEPGMAKPDLQHLIDLYDAEIRWVDLQLARLMAELMRRGLLQNTAVIVTADHGDAFFEHGDFGHRGRLYNTTLRVPLILRLPSAREGGRRSDAPVSLVDVAPTLVDLAGAAAPADFQGVSLLASLRSPTQRPIFAGISDRSLGQRAILEWPWKFIYTWESPHGKRRELYRLDRDPEEERDLSRLHAARAQAMEARLVIWHRLAERRGEALGEESLEYYADLARQLRALGYL